MDNNIKLTESEMLNALKRSGYILESEILNYLSKKGFFIEANQVIEDPFTGKSREIDLLAEHHSFIKERSGYKTASKIKFVFEIKNNKFPIVLLNPFEFSPNIEDWMGLKEALTIPEGLHYDWVEGYYEELINTKASSIYSQYCSFHKKKQNDELMALHPDIMHIGLAKITQYCEEMVKLFDKDLIYENPEKDDYFRHFLFLPVLLINDDLYELNNEKLRKTESSILVYNYHYDKEPKIAYIYVITKNGFPAFIESMLELEDKMELRMIEIRKSNES